MTEICIVEQQGVNRYFTITNLEALLPILWYFPGISLPFSKVIRFIRFNRQCNESSGILVHFHSGLVLYMCIQACVSCLEV